MTSSINDTVSVSMNMQSVENDCNFIVMSLYWKSNKLGCVYYLHQFHELYFFVDIEYHDIKHNVVDLLDQIHPTHIVMCNYNESDMTEILQNYGSDITVEVMNSKNYVCEQGRYTLVNWYIQHMLNTTTPQSSLSSVSSSYSSLQQNELPGELLQHMAISDIDVVKQAQHRLACLIPMDSTMTISCVSPLFEHFKSPVFESQQTSLMPMLLKTIALKDTMYVPKDLIRSLGILHSDIHPSTHQKRGKESTSLLSLLNYTVSPTGTHLLREWILRPSLDKKTLNDRHQSVAFLLHAEGIDITSKGSLGKKLSGYLKNIRNIARVINHIHEQHASVAEWQQLLKFAFYALKIVDVIQGLPFNEVPIFEKILAAAEIEHLTYIGDCINNMISFKDSHIEGRVTVQKGVDEQLDNLRVRYEYLDHYLLQIAQEVASNFPDIYKKSLNVVYFPQLGYLLTLPSSVYDQCVGCPILEGCELQFTTNDNYYYKNIQMKDMDQKLGDIHGMMIDKQLELIDELSRRILQHQEQLLLVGHTLAELDCILSLSKAALINNYTRPTVTDDDCNELIIIQGRHPLQEHNVDTFIPNDTCIYGGKGNMHQPKLSSVSSSSYAPNGCLPTPASSIFSRQQSESPTPPSTPPLSPMSSLLSSPYVKPSNITPPSQTETASISSTSLNPRDTQPDSENGNAMDTLQSSSYYTTGHQHPCSVMLLSGANFSGKSVYLKQVGLIVYMTQVGSFVPAKKAIIGLTDKIFTSVQTVDSISTNRSAFGYDLQQMSQAIQYATEKSLVILDEFGKGTTTTDGASLFAAVLNEYIGRGRQCPKVVACTHFHKLMGHGILVDHQDTDISFYTTEIIYNTFNSSLEDIQSSTSSLSSSYLTTQPSEDLSLLQPLTQSATALSSSQSPGELSGREQVVFLYRVIPGCGLSTSVGTWCASLAGITEDVLQRATEISQELIKGVQHQLLWTTEDQERYDQLLVLKDRFMAIRGFTDDGERISDDLQFIIESVQSLFLVTTEENEKDKDGNDNEEEDEEEKQ